MSFDFILFILRLLSAALLLAIFGALIWVLWRDYQHAALQTQSNRRVYGRLVGLVQFDKLYTPTGAVYPLRPLTSMGRSPTNSIVIDDTFASGEHATVALKEGQWWLEDRKSRNGTLLNGDTLTSPVIITEGDIISIGQTHFRLELDL